ncbi:MAG: phosphotransferase [Lewinellaceae bacterium]|nr:phosphotransferase [Lewinellaceae bacterium]
MVQLETILRQFIRFDACLELVPVGHGQINDSYHARLLQSGKETQWLLQKLNTAVFTQPELVMDNLVRVNQWLLQSDYRLQICPPLSSLHQQWLFADADGGTWRVFPFVKDAYAPERAVSAAVAAAAAGAYGQFSRALSGFPVEQLHETLPGFHDTLLRWQNFEKVRQADPCNRVGGLAAEMEAVQAMYPVFERVDQLKKRGGLPLRVTHNDTKAGNVLLHRESHTALAVIDLDTVMPGSVLSDYGDMVRSFVPNLYEDARETEDLQLQTGILDALTQAYWVEMEEVLTPLEQSLLPLGALWMTGEQALRFLSDYIDGDQYYKIRYPGHNLDRARNQIALFHLLEKYYWRSQYLGH